MEMGILFFPEQQSYQVQLHLLTTNVLKYCVTMSESTGLSISQVTDEVLYTGLVKMQEMDELEE
jgi:hypothetical protein